MAVRAVSMHSLSVQAQSALVQTSVCVRQSELCFCTLLSPDATCWLQKRELTGKGVQLLIVYHRLTRPRRFGDCDAARLSCGLWWAVTCYVRPGGRLSVPTARLLWIKIGRLSLAVPPFVHHLECFTLRGGILNCKHCWHCNSRRGPDLCLLIWSAFRNRWLRTFVMLVGHSATSWAQPGDTEWQRMRKEVTVVELQVLPGICPSDWGRWKTVRAVMGLAEMGASVG